MALRSRYKEKSVAAPPDIPEEPIQPSETTRIEFTDKAEPSASVAIVSADEYPEPDEATLALQNQLAHLKKSEELQRQYAQHMAQQAQRPMSREEKLATWRANGGDEGDISFLESNPQMIDRHDVTVVAAEEAAQQGHERGTDDHRQATKEIFDRHLGHQQAQPAASVQPAAADPAGFFQPPPQPAHSRPDPASYVSAPVSRGVPSGETGYRPARQIKLTPQEQEYARVAGVSDVEYARQKQRLAQLRASGQYGGERER